MPSRSGRGSERQPLQQQQLQQPLPGCWCCPRHAITAAAAAVSVHLTTDNAVTLRLDQNPISSKSYLRILHRSASRGLDSAEREGRSPWAPPARTSFSSKIGSPSPDHTDADGTRSRRSYAAEWRHTRHPSMKRTVTGGRARYPPVGRGEGGRVEASHVLVYGHVDGAVGRPEGAQYQACVHRLKTRILWILKINHRILKTYLATTELYLYL